MLDPRIITVLRRAAATRPHAATADAVLVERFAQNHDQAAFTELVMRHGPAVWALCHRLLRSEPDAEDVFQATFLVLAHRAGRVRKAASVGSWLYGVAFRLSRKARARRPLDPTRLFQPDPPLDPADRLTWAEVRTALDEELARLPDQFRAPLLLCYLRGRTQDEAAAELGWKPRTLKARLAHGRNLLRRRLTRRGVELPAALAGPLLAADLTAAMPPRITGGLIAAAVNVVGRQPPGDGVSVAAAELARTGVMTMTNVRIAAIAAIAGLVTAGTVLGLRGGLSSGPQTTAPPAAAIAAAPGQATWQEAARLYGQQWGYVSLSPDGRVLATFADNDQIVFWDVETWTGQARYDIRPRYGSNYLGYLPFAPDGRTVALFGSVPVPGQKDRRREITLIDPATGRERGRLPGQDAVFSRVGQILAIRSGDAIILYNLATGSEVRLPSGKLLATHVTPMAFSRDGALLYVASAEGGRLFEVATGKLRGTPAGYYPLFSPDSRTLATYLPGPEVKLWDAATGLLRATLRGFAAPACTFEFSPDSRTLLTSGNDIISLKPDGEQDFSALNKPKKPKTGDLDLRLWNVATGQELARLPGRIRLLRAGQLTPDGRAVVYQRLSGHDDDMEIVFWDVASQKERLVLREPGGIEPQFITPDGATLVAASGYLRGGRDTLRAWDLATGRELPRPAGAEAFAGPTAIAALAADGRTFVLPVSLPGGKVGESPKLELRVYRLSAGPVTKVVRGSKPEPQPNVEPAAPKPTTPAGREWQVLRTDSAASEQEFGRALQAAQTPEQQRELGMKRSAAVEGFAARAIDLARKYPGDPEAVEALTFALRYTNGGTDGKIADLGRSAVALVKQNYLMSEQLGTLVPWLTHQQREDAEELLQNAFEKSPHRTVRGRAGFWLAYALTEQAEAARLFRQMPEIAGPVKDRPAALARLRATDPDAVEQRAERLYEVLRNDYADVTEQAERPDRIGPAAERALFGLRNLGVGKTAPGIEGTDLDGQSLQLRDYRGKVVVLLFCGDWCGPCKAMKPNLREMVKTFSGKPFALLEVNSDDDPGAVKDRRKADGTTWPCWADGGRDGPIHRQWNVTRWPTVYVLDDAGVIRFKNLRDEPLAKAVEQLLK
jgi:RNA polymerase sigma factor (sigma-70 family)